ncbi:MAG: hypothetical protein H0X66_19470 [Verrucomicrobia bacterium]|nr:hypothetical protein [Verrucomicrobiota bacterium]
MARKSNFELMLILNSLGAYVGIFLLMYVFAKVFGESAMPAIEMMLKWMWVPGMTFLLGVCLFVWRRILSPR